ncbi:MAG: hypothetical protein NZL83_04225 [Candidatus Absconditabacterales bacterium]|nr:hypothetical protein [Candidatus Absconditabacterales bacterium]
MFFLLVSLLLPMVSEKMSSLKKTPSSQPSLKPQLAQLKTSIEVHHDAAIPEQEQTKQTTQQSLDALASSLNLTTHHGSSGQTSSHVHATRAPKDSVPFTTSSNGLESKVPDLTQTMDDKIRQAFFYEEFVKAGLTTTDFADIIDLMEDDWNKICEYRGGGHRITHIAQIIKVLRHKRSIEAQTNALAFEQHKKKRTIDERKDALGILIGDMIADNPGWIEDFLRNPNTIIDFFNQHGPKLTQLLSLYPNLPDQTKEQLGAIVDQILLALINGAFLEIYEIHIGDDGSLIINGSTLTIKLPVKHILTDEQNSYHSTLEASWTTLYSHHTL